MIVNRPKNGLPKPWDRLSQSAARALFVWENVKRGRPADKPAPAMYRCAAWDLRVQYQAEITFLWRATMRQLCLLIVAVMSMASILTPIAWAASPFDGEWKVLATNKTGGRCIQNYTFPITIQNGWIRGSVSVPHGRSEVKGRVSKDGSFSWNWRHGKGKLSQNEGTGEWVTTAGPMNTNCSGDLLLQREK